MVKDIGASFRVDFTDGGGGCGGRWVLVQVCRVKAARPGIRAGVWVGPCCSPSLSVLCTRSTASSHGCVEGVLATPRPECPRRGARHKGPRHQPRLAKLLCFNLPLGHLTTGPLLCFPPMAQRSDAALTPYFQDLAFCVLCTLLNKRITI